MHRKGSARMVNMVRLDSVPKSTIIALRTPHYTERGERKMTYREILMHLGKEVSEANLYRLGHWLDEDGAAAVSFPDAMAPLDEEDLEWEYKIQRDLGW